MDKELEKKSLPFYLPHELKKMGFKKIGKTVVISRKASIHNPEKIIIGSNVLIDDYSILSAHDEIILGNYIHINSFSALYARSRIVMEDFSGLSSYVALYTESDDYSGGSLTNPTVPKKYKPNLHTGPITLKKHVIVGTHSAILPNVTVEIGTAIGSYSLVKEDCEPWSIYVGCPARRIHERKQDLLEYEEDLLK
jgi:dTDP-4-amino-4,6-dideoxy-D-glucose acyltransferase